MKLMVKPTASSPSQKEITRTVSGGLSRIHFLLVTVVSAFSIASKSSMEMWLAGLIAVAIVACLDHLPFRLFSGMNGTEWPFSRCKKGFVKTPRFVKSRRTPAVSEALLYELQVNLLSLELAKKVRQQTEITTKQICKHRTKHIYTYLPKVKDKNRSANVGVTKQTNLSKKQTIYPTKSVFTHEEQQSFQEVTSHSQNKRAATNCNK